MIVCDPLCYLLWAFLLLVLPLSWLLSAACAALIHEFGHLAAVLTFGEQIRKIRICPGGCVIETGEMAEPKQILCILAGPMASLSLLFFRRKFPLIALLGLFQGMYNLLPVLPMDGGRVAQILLYRIFPKKADVLMTRVQYVSVFLAAWGIIRVGIIHSAGVFPWILAGIWLLRMLPRKIPCKEPKIGVQ